MRRTSSLRDHRHAARDPGPAVGGWRTWLVGAVLTLGALALLARAVYLQVIDQDFLARQGDARILRDVKLSANRGMVYDRNGEPLAVSTPVDTVWADPRKLTQRPQDFARLAKALDRDPQWLARRVTSNLDREFVYLVRHMRPQDAARVKALGIPGVDTLREYRRYYPHGEVTGHLLGFTNVDDVGQEGVELAFDQWLGGEPGIKRVMRDREGRTIQEIERIKAPRPGQDLRTSIDLRVQYLAYRALKQAVQENDARGGSVVVLDIATGEVLAMVNQPAFNPNDREQYLPSRYRNRATNDFFEPGSSIKPFVVAAGMKTGRFHADTLIDTGPGSMRVGIKTVRDKHNLGTIDVRTVLAKSSNVGVVKIALTLKPQEMWTTLHDLGFGAVTGSGFPGESAGILTGHEHWRSIGQATMSYGYGLSVTPLQLAQAYAVLGAGGLRRPVSLRRVDSAPDGERVLEQPVAREVVRMLESVVSDEGTARRAAVMGYRVSGKTGTAWKAADGGYNATKYMAVFGGVVPSSNPRLAAVVVIDEPSAGRFYGGEVAAPVFSEVMSGALRLLAIPPDDLQRIPATTLVQAQDPW
ncbi:MAG TPA: penicillin-binding transpeptidase domain-containing protein [Steroidobacteraceae bacterium]|nr:penicillin-binding transpeptidase domain-containing protein [Steroidobacteraceae bacterium]